MEVEHAKMIRDEVQASEAESLEGREDGRCQQPSVRGHGELQQAKANRIAQAHEAGGAEMKAIRSPGWWTHDVLPTDGAKIVDFRIGWQLNLLEVCIVHRNWMWPTMQ
jgi:hypothetical protein